MPPEVTIIQEANQSELPAVEPLEEIAEEIEALETVTDSAVEIASIEAAARVAIVETQAAVELAAIDAASNKEENSEWIREAMNSQGHRITELEARLSTLQALQEVEAMEPEAEAIILTPQSTLDATSETETEATPESGEENQEAEAETEISAALDRAKRVVIPI